MNNREGYIQGHMRDGLANHVLREVLDAEGFRAFYLKKPEGGRMMSTMLMFTPEGIVITGDIRPDGGAWVAPGHDLGWFLGLQGSKHGEYLCSKFMHKEWQNEVAKRDIEGLLADAKAEMAEDPEDDFAKSRVEGWMEMLATWDDLERNPEVPTERAMEIEQDAWDYGIGMDYNLADAGWLCAIQERFATLYEEA